MLHVTNGDIAGALLSRLFDGEVLPWRDVLHEGPVRAGLSLEQLSGERAAFIAGCGWGSLPDLQHGFRERDEVLKKAQSHEEVVLWFEHDLYDQLQLIQVLDWLVAHPHASVSLICEAEHVGNMSPERMRELFGARQRVTPEQFSEAQRAWAAFRGDDPSKIPVRTDALRFLGAALRRQLEEYPWTTDDLSRLERRVLELLEGQGPLRWTRVFTGVEEEPIYLGDVVLRWHLARMEKEGLIEQRGGLWALRSRKRSRRVPRWLGGVRVDDACPWRWDPAAGKLLRR